jgi:hypothetical protein
MFIVVPKHNLLKKVIQFSTFNAKKISVLKAEKSFSLVPKNGRIIRAYEGIVPYGINKAQHILRCEHLRQLPEEKFAPYRAEENYTHQIWLWYKLNNNPEKLELLFRGQFDFSIPDINSDLVAQQIADFLVYLMLNAEGHQKELFRHQYSYLFWSKAVEKKLESLQKKSF